MRHFIFFVGLFASTLAFSQDRGKVEVVKDPLIDTLIARRLSLKVKTPEALSSNGYRVQIFSGSGRNDAFNAQAKLQAKYSGMRTYIIYNEPDFKVRAGDFRTRLEAEKFKQELQSSFTGLFIIAEKINIPKAETGND
jgi:hypothetical protein